MKRQIIISLVVIFVLLLTACTMLCGKKETPVSYQYKVPDEINDGWLTAHMGEVNLDEKLLTKLIQNILNKKYENIHSILIVKDGKLVLEEYFTGKDYGKLETAFTHDDLHGVMSVTKSFASTLIGIAIDKGMIKDTDEDLVSFFPEYKKLLGEKGKKIKLRHVLSMTAGLDWDEITYLYSDNRNPYWIMLGPERSNIIKYILSRPVKEEPGHEFIYNGGLSILLGKIIEKRSHLKTVDFAQKYLFEPLGIEKYEWGYYDFKREVSKTDGGLYLRPRDMAKLGYLYVNKGQWKNRQIISSKWINEATKRHIDLYPFYLTGYGYQWWLYTYKINGQKKEIPVADGWGGQRIFTFPDQDMIVVFTAGNHSLAHRKVFSMMYGMVKDYVLPAVLNVE